MRRITSQFRCSTNDDLLTFARVWSQISSSISSCRSVFAENESVSDGLKKFSLRLVSSAAEKIGWEFSPEEDFLTGQLRKLLLGMAAGAGHDGYVSYVACNDLF